MIAGIISYLKLINRILPKYRLFISAGASIAAGMVLVGINPLPISDPIFRYVSVNRPDLYRTFVSSYTLFMFTTAYLVLSMFFSLAYIHFYADEIERMTGALPSYSEPCNREQLFFDPGRSLRTT